MPVPTRAGLLELPDSALKKVAKSVIGLGADGVFTPGQGQGLRAVTLARTCRRLRSAAAAPIRVVRFEAPGAWPALKAFGPHVWDELEELDCVVDRSSFLGFLKWLLPARGLKVLKLRVIGAPYGAEKLSALERMLLGRLFTQIGSGLVELQVSGIDTKAVLYVVLFQCSELRVIDIGHYAEAGMDTSTSTLFDIFTLVCLVNSKHIERVQFPYEMWAEGMDQPRDGKTLPTRLEVVWGTLWGSYRAGLKESAVNLPTDEDELVASFQKMNKRFDALEGEMKNTLATFRETAADIEVGDVPCEMLFRNAPRLRFVNGNERPRKE